MNLKEHIRGIPNFPKPGILFYDISTLLRHGPAFKDAIAQLCEKVGRHKPDRLVGIESRGFLVAAPVAYALGCGFVMVRKKQKLPGQTLAFTYALEYGTDTIEVQADAVEKGQKVVILDDLLATGGTAAATVELLRKLGAEVKGTAFIIELAALKGRARLDVPVDSLIVYED
jgi:adenine phosphoribosyltransferase